MTATARSHPGIRGAVKHDFSRMIEAARLRKVHELLGLVEEIKRGPEMPTPLETAVRKAAQSRSQLIGTPPRRVRSNAVVGVETGAEKVPKTPRPLFRRASGRPREVERIRVFEVDGKAPR